MILRGFPWFLLFILLSFNPSATLGDKILQERNERMRAAGERLNPLRGVKIPSSLENLENVGGGIQLVSEGEQGRSLNLLEAARIALKENPALKGAAHKVASISQLAASRPTARRFQADFKTGLNLANNLDNDPRDFKHRRIFDVSHQDNSYYFDVDLRLPLLDGGKSRALIEQGILEEQLQETKKLAKKQAILAEVAKTYVSLVLLEEELRQADLQIELHRQIAQEEDRKPTQDPRFPVELLDARLNLDQSLQKRIDLRSRKRMLSARLRSLLGWNETQRFRLDKNARTRVIRESLDALRVDVKNNSPHLKKLELAQKIMDQKRKALHSIKELGLDLMGKTSYTKLVESQGIDEIRYLVGIELKTNLTDGRRTAQKMSSNREDSRAIGQEIASRSSQIQAELESTFLVYQDYKARIPAHLQNAKLARRIQLEAEDRFQKGQIPSLRLMKSRVSFQNSLIAYYRALGQLIKAKLKIFEMTGSLNEDVFG
jgi:outer membrane protein TolC